MNILIALLTGNRERLTRKNLKLDAFVLTALILLVAVVGTVSHSLSKPNLSQAAFAETENNVTKAPTSSPSSSMYELLNIPTAKKTPESLSASPTASAEATESPTPTSAPTEASKETSEPTESPSATSEPQARKTTEAVKVEGETARATTPAPIPVPAPKADIPSAPAPVVVAPPVSSAPSYPVSAIPAVAYRTTIHLNMRSGPGSDYGIIGDGVTGTTVNGTGRASGGWYEVKLGGMTGWMSSQHLQKIEVGANSVAGLQAFAGAQLGNDKQLQCLVTLWNRESNWNYTAMNSAYAPGKPATPTYQAYGIAQAAPGIKMATFGADWETNPRTQILWGLDYIAQRYGSPCNALDHSYSVGWY